MPIPSLKIYKHQSFFVVLFVTRGSTSQTTKGIIFNIGAAKKNPLKHFALIGAQCPL